MWGLIGVWKTSHSSHFFPMRAFNQAGKSLQMLQSSYCGIGYPTGQIQKWSNYAFFPSININALPPESLTKSHLSEISHFPLGWAAWASPEESNTSPPPLTCNLSLLHGDTHFLWFISEQWPNKWINFKALQKKKTQNKERVYFLSTHFLADFSRTAALNYSLHNRKSTLFAHRFPPEARRVIYKNIFSRSQTEHPCITRLVYIIYPFKTYFRLHDKDSLRIQTKLSPHISRIVSTVVP